MKKYLLIFTCLNIRAVHIELVPSLSIKDLLLTFVKFTNTHCHPSCIYTDNASNYLSAGRILNESNFDDPMASYLERNGIKHIKIPLYSAWMGAAWERLFKLIKQCINKSIRRSKLE